MSMTIDPKFKIGQEVYLRTDPDQMMRLISGYVVRRNSVLYMVSFMNEEHDHADYELSAEKNVLMSLGVDKESEAA